MPEPNPVWGVHVVSGAVTAALVRRTESGGYEVLETIADRAPEDPAGALRHAQSILSRRDVARRGAFVAVPDANGCLVTAQIPPEELDLSEHEITNELFEWTTFEPDSAELRNVCVLREGRRQERLVAALPHADHRRFLEVLEQGDISRIGVGFGGVATWRGARALGLVPADGFVVEVLPRITQVYAAIGTRVRRHLLAIGEVDIQRDATAVDVLARDLAQLAAYHRAQRRGDDRPAEEARFSLAGLGATSPGVRQRLASVLGPRMADAPTGESSVVFAERAATAPPAAFAGAVGAALESLRPPEERLVLRHGPTELPAYRERSPRAPMAAAAVLLVAAAGGYAMWQRAQPALATKSADVQPVRQVPPAPPPPQPAHVPEPVPDETPSPAADVAEVEALSGGRARVRWPAGRAGRVIKRRFAGGEPGDEVAVPVYAMDALAGEWVDEVPGPSGTYSWSVDDGPPASATLEVSVALDLLGPGDNGGARFLLRRNWHGVEQTLTVDVAPGGRVAGVGSAVDGAGTEGRLPRLSFDSGWKLGSVRTRAEVERAPVRVPCFLPDGRVERGPEGSAVTEERVVERERRIFEADGVAPDGTRHTWSRKMTDG